MAILGLEGLFLQLTTPIQRLLDGVTERVMDTNQSLRDLRDLRAEIEQLESLVDQLMVENVRLKEFEAQNEDLRKKLNFAETHPDRLATIATLLGMAPAPVAEIYAYDDSHALIFRARVGDRRVVDPDHSQGYLSRVGAAIAIVDRVGQAVLSIEIRIGPVA